MEFCFKIKLNTGKQRFIGLYTVTYKIGNQYKYTTNYTFDLKNLMKKYLTLFKCVYLVNFFRFRSLSRMEVECCQSVGSILNNFLRGNPNEYSIVLKDKPVKMDNLSHIPFYFGEYYLFDNPIKISRDFFINPMPHFKKTMENRVILEFD